MITPEILRKTETIYVKPCCFDSVKNSTDRDLAPVLEVRTLDLKIAQKIVDKISHTMNYEITIVGMDGIIVASRLESSIGSFHRAARRMLAEGREMELSSGDEVGGSLEAGVCVRLCYDGQTLGVLAVAGNPEDILGISHIVKLSAETIIEYELFKERIRLRSSKKDLFVNTLLYHDDTSGDDLRQMAESLGFDLTLVRVALLIHYSGGIQDVPAGIALRTVAENPLHSYQDITTPTREGDLLIFKSIAGNSGKSIAYFRENVELYCKNAEELLAGKCGMTSIRFYAGSLQNNIDLYRFSFQHAMWIKSADMLCSEYRNPICFFIDHLAPYMQSLIASTVFPPIFGIYASLLSEEEKTQLLELGDALDKSRMNLARCAKMLHLHRNTLSARMQKIRHTFGMDPAESPTGLQFFSFFIHFLKENRKKNGL